MNGDEIAALAQEVRNSGVLGRSEGVMRLFDFLIEASSSGAPVREADIAVALFGKSVTFDASQDARVRVYVHRLRKRLDQYYTDADASKRLAIPKGEYRLVVEAAAPPQTGRARLREFLKRHRLAAFAAGLVALNLWLALWPGHHDRALEALHARAPWSALLANKRPVALVIGDYYILSESDDHEGVDRLVREYDINSPQELDTYLMEHPEKMGRYQNLDLYYLPMSSAFAIRAIMPMLSRYAKAPVKVVLSSELTPELIRDNNIVYLGYLSGMGMLREPAFAGSRFAVGDTYDELIDQTSGKRYVSSSGGPDRKDGRQSDFGYFSSFSGPNGNVIVVVAGMRDIGLMQTAEAVTQPAMLDAIARAGGKGGAFESLLYVVGIGRSNLNGKLLLAAPVKADKIWSPLTVQPAFPSR